MGGIQLQKHPKKPLLSQSVPHTTSFNSPDVQPWCNSSHKQMSLVPRPGLGTRLKQMLTQCKSHIVKMAT